MDSEQIDAKAPARLGDWFYLTIEMMPGERLLRSAQAMRMLRPKLGAEGYLYLTDMRLVWSPPRPLAWLKLVRQAQVIPLTEIARCEEGESSFWNGWPIDVYTSDARYQYYPHTRGIGRAFREDTQGWVEAISRAVETAKEQDS